jgi:hypothetical protein
MEVETSKIRDGDRLSAECGFDRRPQLSDAKTAFSKCNHLIAIEIL